MDVGNAAWQQRRCRVLELGGRSGKSPLFYTSEGSAVAQGKRCHMTDHPVVEAGVSGDEKWLLPIVGGQRTSWSPWQAGSKQAPPRHRALPWLPAHICQ